MKTDEHTIEKKLLSHWLDSVVPANKIWDINFDGSIEVISEDNTLVIYKDVFALNEAILG